MGAHTGRCFRDRRRTSKRKLKQHFARLIAQRIVEGRTTRDKYTGLVTAINPIRDKATLRFEIVKAAAQLRNEGVISP